MQVFWYVITAILSVAAALVVLRAWRGNTIFDRILAANLFSTQTIALVAVVAFVLKNSGFIDVAIAYALLSFVGTIAFLRFFNNSA